MRSVIVSTTRPDTVASSGTAVALCQQALVPARAHGVGGIFVLAEDSSELAIALGSTTTCLQSKS